MNTPHTFAAKTVPLSFPTGKTVIETCPNCERTCRQDVLDDGARQCQRCTQIWVPASRADVVRAANEVGSLAEKPGAPIISLDCDRETLIAWLCWNDSNGCYTDAETKAEGFDPLTLETAWALIEEALR